jgi:hypothetical protein
MAIVEVAIDRDDVEERTWIRTRDTSKGTTIGAEYNCMRPIIAEYGIANNWTFSNRIRTVRIVNMTVAVRMIAFVSQAGTIRLTRTARNASQRNRSVKS